MVMECINRLFSYLIRDNLVELSHQLNKHISLAVAIEVDILTQLLLVIFLIKDHNNHQQPKI